MTRYENTLSKCPVIGLYVLSFQYLFFAQVSEKQSWKPAMANYSQLSKC